MITGDSSIACGTRRIEALTGEGAIVYVRRMRSQINQMAQALKTSAAELADRVLKLQETVKRLEKEKKEGASAAVDPKKILEQTQSVGDVRVAVYCENGMGLGDLRRLSDSLRSMHSKLVYFLGASSAEKINYVLGMSPRLKQSGLNMGELKKSIDSLLGAQSGGREDLVQGGAPNQGQLEKQKGALEAQIVSYLREKFHPVG